MAATKILVNAVHGSNKSAPFVCYLTKDVELDKKVVVRLDDAVNRDGEPQLKVSNANAGIIVSHQPEYLSSILKGFRYHKDNKVYAVVERFKDDIPSINDLAKLEAH